ncbi:hypothetical protein EJB05_31314, partial [Eragrostis curvula]
MLCIPSFPHDVIGNGSAMLGESAAAASAVWRDVQRLVWDNFSTKMTENGDGYPQFSILTGRGNLNNILAEDGSHFASQVISLTAANGKMCQLCEQYSTEALLYLKQNETKIEILSILHHACANVAPFKQQCITLVDYYIPLFFLEVSAVNPEKFCESVHLCKKGTAIRLQTRENACGLCHHVLVEVLMMLKNPNTQTEVMDLLLKSCSKAKNYEQQVS